MRPDSAPTDRPSLTIRARSAIRRAALALPLLLPLLPACNGDPGPGTANNADSAGETGSIEDQPKVATVTKIRGSRGLQSPDLPEGAFLGEGGALHAGQWVDLPRGTRVELELESGQRLRIDEDSKLRMPTVGEEADTDDVMPRLELARGRLIVLADATPSGGQSPIEIVAADDRLVVQHGEAELHHAGETRHYGVIQGKAILHTAEREIPLGAGASISTPAARNARPEAPVDPKILAAAFTPELSLEPLHESAWASAFEDSQRIAEDLPEGVGSLVARRAGSKVERQSLRLSEQKVKVTISGRIARTEIEQAFANDSRQTLEGIYQFPLPADASISDLQLLVRNTWMRGEMLEKQRARRIFREIVDATVPRDPALLQWDHGGVFKLNIFPIPGKGERRIKIAYTQVLPAVGDKLRYRYPMGGSGATATEIGDFEFEVEVDGEALAGEELDELMSGVSTPMAELSRERRGETLALSMHEREYQPTHELGVDIPIGEEEERRVIAATHRDKDGQGYFMLSLRPDLQLTADPRPVHYAFVMDRSHGTTPELWTAAEGMTKAMLATLEPDDRFTVLACDTACDRLSVGLQAASQDKLGELDRFFDGQVLAGASDIGNMLEQAAASLGDDPNTEAERVIVYLGDGSPSSGALTPDELGDIAAGPLANHRIQAVALGARSDLLVLDNLVRQSGGDLIQADARDDLETVARELRLRAQVPVARDLNLELPPGLTDVYPRSIPALRPGDTLTLVGKLAEGDATMLRGDVRLAGRGPSGEVDERFQIMLDAEYGGAGAKGVHAHLPRTWAQHEITHLTQTEGAAARDRIVELSREYNVLSRWTALLVLENDRMYREFNVARKAGKTDSWDGKLGGGDEAKSADEEAEKREVAVEEEAEPSAGPTTTSKTESSRDEDASAAEALPGGSAPAPEAAPSPDEPADFGGFDGDPGEAARERSSLDFDDEAEDFAGFEDFEQGESAGGFDGSEASGLIGGGSKTKGASGSGSGFAPAPPKKDRKKKRSSKPSQPRGGDNIDCIFDPALCGGGGGSGWSGGGRSQRWRPAPQMVLRDASGPSGQDRARIAELQRLRDAKPGDRKAHRQLVRRAIRDGHGNARAFAAAWAEADPDHAPALLAHADVLAAEGDPRALRAYASAVEVAPFSTRLHGRMADALTRAGDFERACSHRRALVSIDPSDGQDAADLVECLVEAGRPQQARAALVAAREQVRGAKGKRALAKAEKQIDAGVQRGRSFLHGSPDLRAELRWEQSENLDLAFVDRRGRRLSVLRPQGVAVREQREGAERVETMTMRQVQGTVFVEVTRPQSRAEDRIRAVLEVKTATGQRRRWTLELEPGTERVALVRWDQRRRRRGWR